MARSDRSVQERDRFAGYRYLAGGSTGVSPTAKTLHAAKVPKLATSTGITLGDTFAEAKRAYPTLRQSGTDFWRTSSGIVFVLDAPGNAIGNVADLRDQERRLPGSAVVV